MIPTTYVRSQVGILLVLCPPARNHAKKGGRDVPLRGPPNRPPIYIYRIGPAESADGNFIACNHRGCSGKLKPSCTSYFTFTCLCSLIPRRESAIYSHHGSNSYYIYLLELAKNLFLSRSSIVICLRAKHGMERWQITSGARRTPADKETERARAGGRAIDVVGQGLQRARALSSVRRAVQSSVALQSGWTRTCLHFAPIAFLIDKVYSLWCHVQMQC